MDAPTRNGIRVPKWKCRFVNLPHCLIGLEACGSAHHWGRKLLGRPD